MGRSRGGGTGNTRVLSSGGPGTEAWSPGGGRLTSLLQSALRVCVQGMNVTASQTRASNPPVNRFIGAFSH